MIRIVLSKKAEKELQMIFGLFILLIITLVILNLFLKTTSKSTSAIGGASEDYFKQAEVEKARQECEALCDNIRNVNTAIEYCGKTVSIDWDGDNVLTEPASFGKWDFCENHVPCFVLASDCGQGQYNGFYCKGILSDPANNRFDYLQGLLTNPNGGPLAGDPDDGCGLAKIPANWKCKFGLYAGGAVGGVCAGPLDLK